MPQEIGLSVKQLVEAAREVIEEITVEEAMNLVEDDSVVIVDIRDVRELQRDGKIPGSFHCPRGMLEFWIDPASPYHKAIFAGDKKFVFHCASGWRSALATEVAQRMGLRPVAHIGGGFSGWKKAGGPVEMPELGWAATD
ncbi:MAG TPA: rhodanese-like domain-containing protein [Rhizobiales bacterium]|nr:molybdopterin biosynthesis protein MoeB [bacterium BMS3Bbin10]HDO52984.1 rhodanese-like domain-containing protein [Hyphomicrobiales bacterium]